MIDLEKYEKMAPILFYEMSLWGKAIENYPVQNFKAGIQIRIQGVDEGDMLIVKSGFALITVVLDDGTETISHIGGVGCAFGYISAISRKPYQTSICAYTDCSCYVISGRDVRLLVEDNASFVKNALHISDMQGDLYFNRITLLAIPQSQSRLMTLLLGFAAVCGRRRADDTVTIKLDLTHQILSEILHLNRVTVSRLMSNFASAGAVEKMGRYYVLNLSVVEILLDGGTNCTE